jgi:hypothetical protein
MEWAGYIQGGRVPRNASVGSSRQQGSSVPSSESSGRVNEVRVGAVTPVKDRLKESRKKRRKTSGKLT